MTECKKRFVVVVPFSQDPHALTDKLALTTQTVVAGMSDEDLKAVLNHGCSYYEAFGRCGGVCAAAVLNAEKIDSTSTSECQKAFPASKTPVVHPTS